MSIVRQLFYHHPHPRLMVAVLIGVGFGLLLPGHWRWVTQILVGWNIMVWSYLFLMAWLMTHADHARVIKMANQEDEHGATILALFSIATLASLVAIVLELSLAKAETSTGLHVFNYLLTGATILGSWGFIGMLFTFHYSRMYYLSPVSQRPLLFPDGEPCPDYWDFLYFAFTIAVAAQTADVSVMTRSMRKVVFAQSILSFMFNVAIIGLSINVLAGVVG
ncbi:MAG: DUF1345 domain-containing protein [Methylovulum sp.]|nr:DUF1345 domain-containing protein [Methylovulum sp.]